MTGASPAEGSEGTAALSCGWVSSHWRGCRLEPPSPFWGACKPPQRGFGFLVYPHPFCPAPRIPAVRGFPAKGFVWIEEGKM